MGTFWHRGCSGTWTFCLLGRFGMETFWHLDISARGRFGMRTLRHWRVLALGNFGTILFRQRHFGTCAVMCYCAEMSILPKSASAEMSLCRKVLVLKSSHAEKSPCRNVPGDKMSTCRMVSCRNVRFRNKPKPYNLHTYLSMYMAEVYTIFL